jgi:hypothetical protein
MKLHCKTDITILIHYINDITFSIKLLQFLNFNLEQNLEVHFFVD